MSNSANGKPKKDEIVRILACKILTAKELNEHYKNEKQTAEIEGTVLNSDDARSLRILWKTPTGEKEGKHALKSLIGWEKAPKSSGNRQIGNLREAELSNGGHPGSDEADEVIFSNLDDDGDVVMEEEIVEPADPNEKLRPHGLLWEIAQHGITIDYRNPATYSRWNPRLMNEGKESFQLKGLSRLDCWRIMMPNILGTACNNFNTRKLPSITPITEHELVKFVGILYAMGLQRIRNREHYWNMKNFWPFESPDFKSKFGISLRRFQNIIKYLGWYPVDDDSYDMEDPWYEVRHFVDQFNHKRATTFMPGWVLCVDESTIKWRGLKDFESKKGCPQVTNIIRKPEAVCIEVRDVACAKSGVIVRLEIMEGKVRMKFKKFSSPNLTAGTAQVLRLTEPWHGMGFLVVGDSAFASVQTAIELLRRGIFFEGLVKTAHRQYPKLFFQGWEFQERGDTVTLTAQVDGCKLIAHAWSDRTVKMLISTCGTTLEGEPSIRVRYRRTEENPDGEQLKVPIKRTQMVEQYFDNCSAIDQANRGRQDTWRIERNVEVKQWDDRVWMSLLAIVGADSYRLYKLQGKEESEVEFMSNLAREMSQNNFPGCPLQDIPSQRDFSQLRSPSPVGSKRSLSVPLSEDAGHDVELDTFRHRVKPLLELSGGQEGRGRRRCRYCSDKCSFYCETCSDLENDNLFCFCGPHGQKTCLEQHFFEKKPRK